MAATAATTGASARQGATSEAVAALAGVRNQRMIKSRERKAICR